MKNFTTEELTLLESYEKGEWNSVKTDLSAYRKIAQENLKKNKRINIRISEKDLLDIKRLAALEGIPYQTLASSILHKFATGRLSA